MQRILADENIPYVSEAFSQFGTVRRVDAEAIIPEAVRATDILLVRSVTQVNKQLLHGSPVRWVGSATIGTDHIDQSWLVREGIAFAYAPGANAVSVVEYVLSVLIHLAHSRQRVLRGRTLGIVGCGNIGGRLARRAPALGLQVLCNDPPLAAAGGRGFVSLGQLLRESDIVTLHVPLLPDTYHMIDDAALAQMRAKAWLVNTSRGSVVDNAALCSVLARGQLGATVLDVWENEPTPDLALLSLVDIATPHIAGHSFDGKIAGTIMLYEAARRHFGAEARWAYNELLQPDRTMPLEVFSPDPDELAWMHALVQQLYDVTQDDARLRRLIQIPAHERADYFHTLRKQYPRRRTFALRSVQKVPAQCRAAVEDALHLRIQ